MQNLPVLATQETQRLRSDYPSIEHLEAGNVAAWLMERQEQLLVVAKSPARIPDLTDWKRTVADIRSEEKEQINPSETDPDTDPSPETTLPERKVPHLEAEGSRKADGISVEAFSSRITSALVEAFGEASQTLPPLFEGLERDGKLLMLRLLLAKILGKEKTIMLAWGVKSGGRSHDKYRMASELIDSMIRDLSKLGFDENNNWGG
jgi:hypothetical protein